MFSLEDHVEKCIEQCKPADDNKEVFVNMRDYLQKLSSKPNSDFYYITVSDSNTCGMNFQQIDELREAGNFASFVRAEGENDKREISSGGSFGVGKGAYFSLSNIRTLLVSSIDEDLKNNFEGVIQLRDHILNNKLYHKVGYYDNYDSDEIGYPISKKEDIPDRFMRKGQIGTDIHVIGIDAHTEHGITKAYNDILKAVLQDFWFAVKEGIVEVSIGESIEITSANLENYLKEVFPSDSDDASARRNDYNPRPYFEPTLKDDSITTFKFSDTLKKIGPCEFYVNKKRGRGNILYMRGAHMLVHMERKHAYNNICGVFVCTNNNGQNKDGNRILKKLENETHDKWEPKEKDYEGISALTEIEKWVDTCLTKVLGSVGKDSIDIESLAQYLPSLDNEDNEVEYYAKDSNSKSSKVDVRPQKQTNKPTIKVTQKIETAAASNIDGDLFGGDEGDEQGIQQKRNNGGGLEPPPPPLPPHEHHEHNNNMNNKAGNAIESDYGDILRYTKIIDVPCKGVSQEINGIVHFLLNINPSKDIEHAAIKISIRGEQRQDTLNIVSSNLGKVVDSSIIDIPLIGGQINKLDIVLSNNEDPLTLIITPYEYK